MTIKERLGWEIEEAFQSVVYPGDDRLGDPEGRDDAQSMTEALRGMAWPTLLARGDRSPLSSPLSLCYLTPKAAHYYLPAYLLYALEGGTANHARALVIRLAPYHGPHPYPK